MLRKFLISHGPEWIIRFLTKSLHSIRRQAPVKMASLDELFPGFPKKYRIAAQQIPTPDVVDMAFLEHSRHLHTPVYTVPEDYVTEIDNLLFCPNNNVLMTPDRHVIKESLNTGDLGNLFIKDFYLVHRESISGYSTPLRSRYSNYYHTLIDNLPRLLALNRPPYSTLDEIKLLCPGSLTSMEKYFISKLAPDNLRVVTVDRWRLYKLEKTLLTPFKTQKFAGYLPERYVQAFREKVLPNRPSKQQHRLFISREKANTRLVENQQELQDKLHAFGFQTIILEELTPAQQVELFYDAEAVVAAHGAGLTNLLFSPHLKVLELFPTWYLIPHFYYLSKSLDHHYTYLCGKTEYRNIRSFSVDIPKVLRLLKQLGIRQKATTDFGICQSVLKDD